MNKALKIFLTFALSILYFLVLKGLGGIFLADYLATASKSQLYSGEIGKASTLASEAVNLNPLEPTYRRNRAMVYLTAALSKNLTEEDKTALKASALREMEAAYSLQPHNIVNLKSLVTLFYFLAVKEISLSESPTPDEIFVENTLSFYSTVKDEAPTDASYILLLGKNLKLLGKTGEGEKLILKARKLRPGIII